MANANILSLHIFRLKALGKEVGLRAFELMNARDSPAVEREISVIGMLAFVSNNLWKFLFGKCADSLEKNTENEYEYMIWENAPNYVKYTSLPKEMGAFTPASFTAGIIEVVLESSNMRCSVSAHNYPQPPLLPLRTVYLIKLQPSVQ